VELVESATVVVVVTVLGPVTTVVVEFTVLVVVVGTVEVLVTVEGPVTTV
jgi:hypothetical protein